MDYMPSGKKTESSVSKKLETKYLQNGGFTWSTSKKRFGNYLHVIIYFEKALIKIRFWIEAVIKGASPSKHG